MEITFNDTKQLNIVFLDKISHFLNFIAGFPVWCYQTSSTVPNTKSISKAPNVAIDNFYEFVLTDTSVGELSS